MFSFAAATRLPAGPKRTAAVAAELFVEFPGSAIQPHEKTAMLDLGGFSVLTLSPEDMIIDRLAAWQFWNSTTD